MTPTDMRNAIAAQCGFIPSKAQQEDIGGNVIPDRVEANEDRYWEEEGRPYDAEDIEEWQRQSERQGE